MRLKVCDILADGGGRNPQPFACSCKAVELSNAPEHLKRSETIHHSFQYTKNVFTILMIIINSR